jgi:hypothetical protein
METPVKPLVKCPKCDKEFKNQGGVNLHARKAHPISDVSGPASKAVTEGSAVTTGASAPVQAEVTFYCPRPLYQTVVVIPEQWYTIEGPAGNKQETVDGVYATFDNGRFTTDDPEIIDYLENPNHTCKYHTGSKRKGGYNDARFPIHSERKIR